jgi:lysophospholipase L1-like esterase
VDSTHFADRLIFPHEPKQIFLRAGGNDIHGGRTPRQVAHDFSEFVRVVHAQLPKSEIIYIGVSPAASRWGESDKYRELNRLIREMALEMPRVGFVDTFDMVLSPTGLPVPELFVKDRLHFSPEGYKLLAERVRPFLAQ